MVIFHTFIQTKIFFEYYATNNKKVTHSFLYECPLIKLKINVSRMFYVSHECEFD